MDLRRLRYFAVTAAERSLYAASSRLNVAQPALSRQIRELEEELDVQLFVRSARGMTLTPAGKVLSEGVERIFGQIEMEVDRTKRAARGEVGHLRIGLTLASAELRFVIAAVAEARRAVKDVEFQLRIISSDQQIDALNSGEIDVGVFYRRAVGSSSGINCEDLRVDYYNLMVSASHALASRPSVHLAEFADEEIIFGTAPSWSQWPETRVEIMSSFLRANVTPKRVTEEINNLSTVVHLVAEGMGVSIMNTSVQRSYRDCGVAYVNIEDLRTPLTLCAAWRGDHKVPLVAKFVALLREKEALDEPLKTDTGR